MLNLLSLVGEENINYYRPILIEFGLISRRLLHTVYYLVEAQWYIYEYTLINRFIIIYIG